MNRIISAPVTVLCLSGLIGLSACSDTSPSSPAAPPASTAAPQPTATSGSGPLPDPKTADGNLPLTTAKSPDAQARVAALDKLTYLVGRWEGEGTMTTQQGKTTFHQTELIRRHLSGDLISVQGVATTPNDPSKAAFSAFAVLRFDSKAKTYSWRAYSDQSPTGEPIETELHVTEHGWYWDTPMGTDPKLFIRHEATFTGDTWSETSRMTRDGGQNWTPTMEMKLTKQH